MYTELINNKIKEAQLLGLFKQFCEKYTNKQLQNNFRNILYNTTDKERTIFNLFKNEYNYSMSDEETKRMIELLNAFLSKKSFRINYENDVKKMLLKKQSYKCAICGAEIDIKSHLDHIIPFKYVGDELDNNLQMLCTTCNLRKNASLDFQIRYYLNLL